MEYSEYQDQAAEYMRLAIPLMKKHGIAMTPANYAVWYEYVSGKNVALKESLEQHIDEHNQLTDQQSRELYERFFDREREQSALFELRQNLKHVLVEVLSYVNTGLSNSKESNSHLNKCLEKLHSDMSGEEVKDVIQEILAETRTAMSAGSMLTQRLNSAVSDMQNIKKDLEDAKRQANTDTLTKLANRKAFDGVIEKVTRDADNSGIEVCMIFCNLDYFKKINDVHGSIVGDQVLKVVAASLKDAVKGRDLVCRYGGEEFAIIILNTSLDNVKKLAENIRIEIAAKRIQRKDTRESLGAITMSFGVARYFPSEGVESFLQRADRALYMSKDKGRNRVSAAPVPIF
ncbi:MAG: GGDEF domain-containing protein [Methylophaga sp.]|nr:MAG: GGDEF domain-containing protein [Methylophaga sp.]